jgi:hypothetical protein
MGFILSSRQHCEKPYLREDLSTCEGFHILHLLPERRADADPGKRPKASAFDNGDSKLKPKNPLSYNGLTDSIQVIS